MSSLGTDIYKGTASYGRFIALVQFYILIVAAIIFFIVGLYLLFQKQTDLIDTTATITKADCSQYTDGKNITYNCMLTVSYMVNDKEMTGTINTISEIPYFTGRTINVTYNKFDITDVQLYKIRNKTIGMIFIAAAIVAAAIGYYVLYVTRTYEMAAAATGASSVISALRM